MLQIFLICSHAVCEKKRTSIIWQMTGWLRHPAPQAVSQSLLVALLQWARPGPTSCGEQPLFLLARWAESAYGDVLGASGQDIVSRAVSSEAEVWGVEKEEHFTLLRKLHPEITFFFFPKCSTCSEQAGSLCVYSRWLCDKSGVSCDFPVEPYLLYKQLLQGLCWSLQCVYVVANSIMQEVCAQL